ncbi:MAG: alpha/beta hydrolase [Parachlamydiales bacterium]|jgi:pimeloyl-ACP methyl ester carboxylesterase
MYYKTISPLLALLACVVFISGCDRKLSVHNADVGEVELAYYTRGSGDPLLMIMGFRGTMSYWDPALLELLEKKYTLILFDNRGVGLSSDTEQDMTTIDQMADDTAGLIKALGYSKVHVLGWSMGSRIAIDLSIRYPELVNGLILCSPNPGGQHQSKRTDNDYKVLTAETLSQEEGLSLIFPKTMEGEQASKSFVERITKAVIDGRVPEDINVKAETIIRQVRALQLWDESEEYYDKLPTIKSPTLVAGGLMDVLDSPENVQTVANRIPFAWAAFFPGAGHDFLSQDYKHFAELVILFLEANRI